MPAPRRPPRRRPLRLGTPESWFERERAADHQVRGARGVVAPPSLRLGRGRVLWDLGAGTAARVAIEAAPLDRRQPGRGGRGGPPAAPSQIRVQPGALRRAAARRRAARAARRASPGCRTRTASSSAAGARELPRILRAAAPRTAARRGPGRQHGAAGDSAAAAASALRRLGFSPQIVQVQVNRSRPMPFGERLEDR
ncbi:MAG: hypothetical protein MZV70_46770 [Desulfobacterales bacterium]|nr:hypothetical protein [Desulfobacterales bacterium]